MKRPLLVATLPYIGGILAGNWISGRPAVLLLCALVLVVLALCWGRARPVLLGLLLFAAGWTNYVLRTALLSPHDLRVVLGESPALLTVRGTLCETPSLRVRDPEDDETWRTLGRIEVSALRMQRQEWQPATGLLAISTPGQLTNFYSGQVVEVAGVAAPPRIAVAEGTFDYRAYLRQQGIYYQLKAGSEQDWRVVASPARPLADRFRRWAQATLALGLPVEDETLRLEWALTLGWKPALTEEVSEPFVQAATYHIFAVDGLRMAIVFGIFFALFRALGMPRGGAGWCWCR